MKLLIGFLAVRLSLGYVYIGNNTYASLPGLFGRFMLDGKLYAARLQYFPDNPFLCELDNETMNRFVEPPSITVPTGNGDIELTADPVIILASRGHCPFQQKADTASLIHKSVQFLMIHNYNIDHNPNEEHELVSMYSEGYSRLVLLSISHDSGQLIKKYLSEQPANVTELGGPLVRFDTELAPGYGDDDVQSMLLSALGLFFMLISFSGCIIILAGTYSQLTNSPNPLMAERQLLTVEEVNSLTDSTPDASHDDEPNDDENVCSVCIDQLDGNITALPCRHRFHTDCIVPWLTERSCLCPLCKANVLKHLQEEHPEMTTLTVWDRVRRFRWTLLDDHSSSDEDDEPHELELTDQNVASDLQLSERDVTHVSSSSRGSNILFGSLLI